MGLLSIVGIVGQQIYPATSVTINRSTDLFPDLTDTHERLSQEDAGVAG